MESRPESSDPSSPGAAGVKDDAPSASPRTVYDPGPFGINVPEMSERDREMFVLGYEFARVCGHIERREAGPIRMHPANMERVRRVAIGQALNHRFDVEELSGWVDFRLGSRP